MLGLGCYVLLLRGVLAGEFLGDRGGVGMAEPETEPEPEPEPEDAYPTPAGESDSLPNTPCVKAQLSLPGRDAWIVWVVTVSVWLWGRGGGGALVCLVWLSVWFVGLGGVGA